MVNPKEMRIAKGPIGAGNSSRRKHQILKTLKLDIFLMRIDIRSLKTLLPVEFPRVPALNGSIARRRALVGNLFNDQQRGDDLSDSLSY